jgi:3,4-dihydroxy 2-butanone 4-phosphate synthase/3,4-dihydroxy 2-butanone 4-phosphate synthase/GTP cyclohydrolase II
MYRGFIAEVGNVVAADGRTLRVRAPKACAELRPGGSICVAGVCVSVVEVDGDEFGVDVTTETARRSTLGELSEGRAVNIELPLRAGDTIEGHLVQGHVDSRGSIVRVEEERQGRRVWIMAPVRTLEALAAMGSISVEGVSLTVAELQRDRFAVALIPLTLEGTTLGALAVGDRVNLEVDLLDRLAQRHEGRLREAYRRVVGAMPWSGIVSGRLGVQKVIAQIRSGGCAVVWDPAREGEGDVIAAGVELKPQTFAFILTQACGLPCAPCDAALLARLELPPMPGAGDRHGTRFHASIDLASGSGTGVSAIERAATVRRLAHPDAVPRDFVSPGHVFPLGADASGLRARAGHTEATVELCRAAGLPPVGICCEVMAPDGHMAGPAELERFALHWGLPLIEIAELSAHL